MRYVCAVWDPSSQTSSFIRCAHTKKRNGRAAAAAGKKTCSWNNVYQSKAEAAHSRLILSSRLVLNMKWTVKIERCAYTSCGFRSLLPVLSFHFAHRFGSSCFKWLCTFDHSKWFVCDSLDGTFYWFWNSPAAMRIGRSWDKRETFVVNTEQYANEIVNTLSFSHTHTSVTLSPQPVNNRRQSTL